VGADLPVQRMNLPANAFERIAVVLLERRVALLLQLAHPGFDGRLVDAGHVVVFVRIDAKRLAQRGQEMFLVQLRVALHRLLVLDALRDVAQFLNCFPFQFVEGISHQHPPLHEITTIIAEHAEHTEI